MATKLEINADGLLVVSWDSVLGPVHQTLTTVEVERLLSALGIARWTMSPPVADLALATEDVTLVPDPEYRLVHMGVDGDLLLSLRDPRFGWLRYRLSVDHAQTWGEVMHRMAEEDPAAQGPSGAH